MPVYLHSLGLKNYRGIGPDWELMPDFKDFNFFVGANNTGKSTVLINDTKKRICEEFSDGRGVAWVTAGREIENYFDFQELHDVIQVVHSKSYSGPANSGGQFDRALDFKKTTAQEIDTADKVKVAKALTKADPNLGVLDLQDRLTELVTMIRNANV